MSLRYLDRNFFLKKYLRRNPSLRAKVRNTLIFEY